MKRITFALAFLFMASFSYAQTSPESYLAQLPAAPKSCCNLQSAEKASYMKSVRSLIDKMDKDILQRKEESQLYVDANRDKIAASVVPHPGTAEKVAGKSGQMTQEERKAGSDEMMRQMGVSPEETRKLKSMTKEEKTAWALANSGKAASKMQGDPQYKDKSSQARLIQNLQMEQRALIEKIEGRKTGILNRFKILDQKAAAAKTRELDPLQRQLASMSGIVISKEQSDRMDQIALKIKETQKRYCETYSPQYLALLDEYMSAIKISLPDYRRFDEIIAKTQMGLDKPIDANNGLSGIEALRDYSVLLAKVFKYDLPYEY